MIRDMRPSDIPHVHQLFAEQPFEYQEPDWTKMIGKVLVDGEDKPLLVRLGRPTIESYVVADRSAWATPGIKAEEFAKLDREFVQELRARGYTDEAAWIPPQCRSFARKLLRTMGWVNINDGNGFIPLLRWFGR